MNPLILACQLLPLAGILLMLVAGQRESRIARISRWTTRLLGLAVLGLLATWARLGFPRHEYPWLTLFRQGDYQLTILFYFDHIGAVYLLCTWLVFSVIVRYCRHYLHREPGYRRFFVTIFGFIFGVQLVIFSGMLDLLFAGWEIVGISSFLLIAFYRHRYQPIRNALRAYSIYRLCDFGLLLAALLIDLLLKGHNHFSELAAAMGDGSPPAGQLALLGLSLLLILAAAGKSAQFPFCFWIPRAMEGPTPSSAMFYGALSIHLGVFLLLRTQPIWASSWAARLLIVVIGGLTVLVAVLSEQMQANIKGQIAYASIAQVGLMFIELGLGFETLALTHCFGNACLRCYQLLVSPSVVTYRLREAGATDIAFDLRTSPMAASLPLSLREALPDALQNTLLVVALQEFNLEMRVRALLWDSFRALGLRLGRLGSRVRHGGIVAAVALILTLAALDLSPRPYLGLLAALAMCCLALLAFTRKRQPLRTWTQAGLSSLLAPVATWLAGGDARGYVEIFLGGILGAWLLGLWVIRRMEQCHPAGDNPFQFRGMDEWRPGLALLLLLAFLGLVGFPLTPAFLGQDLLLYHVSGEHAWLAPLITVALVLNGISLSGVYMRLCAGRPTELRSARPAS